MYKINGLSLDLESFVKVARFNEEVAICDDNKPLIHEASMFVQEIVRGDKAVYGINTGFGKLSSVAIRREEVKKLQENLLMSHACGVGEPFHNEVVRGMMLLRINALVKGYSGIRLEVLEKMVEFLNKDLVPVVFSQGSLGASGDLAPLSHMSLPLVGLGEVYYQGQRYPAKEGLKLADITPLSAFEAKEGLSLINGTQAMTSVGALVLYDAFILEKTASLSLAMTLEALEGIIDAFDERIHQLRGHQGQMDVAARIRKLLSDSRLITKDGEKRVQDAYSLRCAPQVHGACLDVLREVKAVLEKEMNAVTDNPIVFTKTKEVISAGNFHGEPLALAFDSLAVALSELANISERRIERLVNAALSNGLPPFLVKTPGINSGFMIVQYSAAALVSENKVLSHPASVDSIPSSANQEDHVSMGTIAARKAAQVHKNALNVIAMELMTAAQAIDFRGGDKLAPITKIAYQELRKMIPFIENDVVMYPLIHQMAGVVREGKFASLIGEDRLS
ncbi:MAG: histidine ammonia-lyase [Candidatus Izemoplasmatales bacterium]|nr:histidine ammonia-lyase [Candidatus Izemoplasmatales bacterium]